MPWCEPYGWYNTTKERDIVAWAPPSDEPPTKLHVPFWAKKSNPCVLATSLHVWADQQLVALTGLAEKDDNNEPAGIGALTNGTPH